MFFLDKEMIAMYCYKEYLIGLMEAAIAQGDEGVASVLGEQIEVYEQQIEDLKEIEESLQPSMN